MLRFFISACLVFALAGSAHAAEPLSELIGKKRVLVLFDKSRSSATLDRQVDLLRQHRTEMSDRDLVVLINAANRETAVAVGYATIPRGSNRPLRRRFKPAEHQTTMVLVGKDGTEKARWLGPVQPDDIFDLIDQLQTREPQAEDGANSATN